MADNKNYTHVFFDLYGTLLDIATDEEKQILRKAAKILGVEGIEEENE